MGRPNTLTQFQTDDKDFQLMQNQWSAVLSPLLKNPLVAGNLLTGIALINGTLVINHKLGRTPQGWLIVDIDAAATVYRNAAFNDLTLSLRSNAAANAAIYVF